MTGIKLIATLALAGFALTAGAQTPACLLAVVNQVNDPSNLSAVCGSNIADQISTVCHGPNIAAASSAFSSICGAVVTSGSASTSDLNVNGSTMTPSSRPTPFASRPSTPISTGGFTTMAGTPTYAPVGPVIFNTFQGPSTPAASYIYQPAITPTPLGAIPATPLSFSPIAVYAGDAANSDGKLGIAVVAALGVAVLLV